eukprot:1898718-Prymnesium_polylepis.1
MLSPEAVSGDYACPAVPLAPIQKTYEANKQMKSKHQRTHTHRRGHAHSEGATSFWSATASRPFVAGARNT